jgi:hypothetical protein
MYTHEKFLFEIIFLKNPISIIHNKGILFSYLHAPAED